MPFTPDTKASVRLYRRHQRYARPARRRYAAQETAFLNKQATRLATTVTAIFNFLYGNSAYTISQAANTGQLKADPYGNRGS